MPARSDLQPVEIRRFSVRFRTQSGFFAGCMGVSRAVARASQGMWAPGVRSRPSEREPRMPSEQTRNRLLAYLSAEDRELLRPSLKQIDLPVRFMLEKPATPIEHVYFPESGIASVVAVQSHETRVEVGLIGPEGMTGLPIVLGDQQTPNTTYMQVAGEGLRISSDAFRKATAKSQTMQKTLLKVVQAFLVQTSHTAIATAHSRLDDRLAGWMLIGHDRAGRPIIPLAQEFLPVL